jgi:hypothetical protein
MEMPMTRSDDRERDGALAGPHGTDVVASTDDSRSRWSAARRPEFYLPALALVCFLVLHVPGLVGPAIRSDGLAYYAYLPAAAIDGDITMSRLASRLYGGQMPDWTMIRSYAPTGRLLDEKTMGVALMQAPFFLAAHVVASILSVPADGFSPPYQMAIGVAAAFYFGAGLWLVRRNLERLCRPRIAALTLVLLALGTNLFHHACYDASFSHIYSFALFAALAWQTRRWCEEPGVSRALGLGAIFGLIALVRIPDLAVGAFALPFAIDARRERSWWMARRGELCAIAGTGAALCSLQALYWHAITGHWLIDSYQVEGFRLLSAKPLSVLFGVKKGLLLWSPLLVLALFGFRQLWSRDRPSALGLAAFLPVQVCIVASWHIWWYGGGFGHRGFTESLALLALPLGLYLERGAERGTRRRVAAATVFTAYSVLLMALYWARVIPYEGIDLARAWP